MTSTSSVSSLADISSPAGMKLTVPRMLGVLVGHRESILAAARDRATIWVGLIFVFAAAVAREYDGEDLRREPWHLLIPLAASLPLSLVLFTLIQPRGREFYASGRSFWGEFRQFLGVFWLTAPLALLYGIPYERMLTPAGAVTANLWTLAIVATWRVVLMIRVTSVLTGRTAGASFWLVMLVADGLAALAIWAMPLPILQVMGGIRLTEAERMLQNVGFMLRFFTLVTLPIWLIGAVAVRLNGGGGWDVRLERSGATRLGPFAMALIALLMWTPILPQTQREQRLRTDAELLLRNGQISAALAEMSRHGRGDYPPAWDPPPRLGWAEPEIPEVLDVMQVLALQPAAPWVRQIYIDKFERSWLWPLVYRPQDSYPRVRQILDALPEGAALIQAHADILARWESSHRASQEPATQPTTRGAS